MKMRKEKHGINHKKNLELIKAEAFEEINRTVEGTNRVISHLYDGVVGLLVNPLLSLVFSWFGQEKTKKDGMAQLEVTLKYAMECSDEETLNKIVAGKFYDYMQYHVLYKRAKKPHKNFNEMQCLMKEGFRIRLKFYAKLLRARGNSYEELMRDAYTKEDALFFVKQQFDLVDEAMDIVRADASLINVPSSVKKDIIKVLVTGFADSRKRIQSRVEGIFRGYEEKEKAGKSVLPLSSLK